MRPTRDAYFSKLASIMSTRSTCARKAVGCVLINIKGHIIGTGYNGVAVGFDHCNEGHLCKGYDLPPGQDSCEAVHAEVNALLQCSDVWAIDTAYMTLSPCIRCTKMLLNTSCNRIVFIDNHIGQTGQELWERAGHVWLQCKDYNDNKRS